MEAAESDGGRAGGVVVERDLQVKRLELRSVESRARRLRREIKEAGGVRTRSRGTLAPRVVAFLDANAGVAFSPADVRLALGEDGDVSSTLRALAASGRVHRRSRGLYESVLGDEEGE